MASSLFELGGLVFDMDPHCAWELPRRGSVHQLIDDGVVIQDKGMDLTDAKIRVNGTFLLKATFNTFMQKYRDTSGSFTFKDDQGTIATVVFEPGSLSWSPVDGVKIGVLDYEFTLRILSVTNWLGLGAFPSET